MRIRERRIRENGGKFHQTKTRRILCVHFPSKSGPCLTWGRDRRVGYPGCDAKMGMMWVRCEDKIGRATMKIV
jgi:hypothetical protein